MKTSSPIVVDAARLSPSLRRLRRRRLLCLAALLALAIGPPLVLPACSGVPWRVEGCGEAGTLPDASPSDE